MIQYLTVSFDAFEHSRHCRHRLVFKHIFVLSRYSLFQNTVNTIPKIMILPLLDVDQSENTMTKILEVSDFIFDLEWNEKCIDLFLQYCELYYYYFKTTILKSH
jgi:hypothetical protein